MKNRILLLVLVLFFSLVFVSSGFANLYIINDKEGKNVCITNISTLISEYGELGYTLILVKYSNLKLKKEGTERTEIKQDLGADIRIVDWTNYIGKTGQYYYIEGILENVGNDIERYVEVKVIAYDRNYKLVTLKRSYADPYHLNPGEIATFKIMITYNPKIEDFELSVDWK